MHQRLIIYDFWSYAPTPRSSVKGASTLSRRPTHPRQGISVAQESLRFVLKEMPDQLGHLHIVILYADNGFKDS